MRLHPLELPAHASLDQYEQQAAHLVAQRASGDAGVVQLIDYLHARECKLRGTERGASFTLADARLIVVREHHFESWAELVEFTGAVARPNGPVSRFETAVDAVINGDATTLARLLRDDPELIRARSTRVHRSTLLHYVGANGVEDYRQKIPANAVEIARILLDAGAEVDALADMYGGGSTTLGLVATSIHPLEAGVQVELMETLLERGARVDGPGAVNGCLANGRRDAAEFLAQRFGMLDLEGAAGVGRLDVVASFFEVDGRLKASATQEQLMSGFAWACEFGRADVIDFLLQRGVAIDAPLKHNGQTALHWAAYGAHVAAVELLLARNAPVEALDRDYRGTPLGWALYGWGEASARAERGDFYATVALLVRAGAKLDRAWLNAEDRGFPLEQKIGADARMLAALRGEMPSSG